MTLNPEHIDDVFYSIRLTEMILKLVTEVNVGSVFVTTCKIQIDDLMKIMGQMRGTTTSSKTSKIHLDISDSITCSPASSPKASIRAWPINDSRHRVRPE